MVYRVTVVWDVLSAARADWLPRVRPGLGGLPTVLARLVVAVASDGVAQRRRAGHATVGCGAGWTCDVALMLFIVDESSIHC